VILGTKARKGRDVLAALMGTDSKNVSTGDGPADAFVQLIKALVEHSARARLYQVTRPDRRHDGAGGRFLLRLEEDGPDLTGQSGIPIRCRNRSAAYIHA